MSSSESEKQVKYQATKYKYNFVLGSYVSASPQAVQAHAESEDDVP